MSTPVITPDEVREFIADYVENNHLLDGVEFSDTRISLAAELAISEYNMTPPIGAVSVNSFLRAGKAILMSGVLWKLFEGQAALLARNTMSYSDGGISLPIEERMQLYQSMAAQFQASFQSSVGRLKQYLNIEDGWGEVRSDQASFPLW
jgi:hypothetical protein